MRYKIILFLMVFLGFISQGRAQEGDHQLWLGGSIEGKIVDKVKLRLEEVAYYSSDRGEFYSHYMQPSLGWGPIRWLNLGLGCRFIYNRAGDDWNSENRVFLDLSLKVSPYSWNLNNRIRLAYRFREGKDDLWRCRNRITVIPPLSLTSWDMIPYLAEEIFFEQHQRGIYRNRLYLGIGVKQFLGWENLKTDTYLMWQLTDTESSYEDIYVLGVMLRLCY